MAVTYEPIATTTLGSAQATITFSSIAASWTDLRIVLTCTSASASNVFMRLNGDTATNYSTTWLAGNGSTASSARTTSEAYARLEKEGTNTTVPILITADIFGYAGSTYKTCLSAAANDFNGSGGVTRIVTLWRSTAAVTSVLLYLNGSVNFNTGTTATLFGIKAA